MAYQLLTDQRSPNYTPIARVPAIFGHPRTVTSITIHWWDDPSTGITFEGARSWLCRTGGDTSAHEIIEHGRVAQIVPLADAAWHTGDTSGLGNASTIGLELSPYATDADYQTAAERIRDIRKTYGNLTLLPHHYWNQGTLCCGVWNIARLERLASGKPSPYELRYPLAVQRPVTNTWAQHHNRSNWGTDWGALTGDQIIAAHPGTVQFAGSDPSGGNMVNLDQADRRTQYLHMNTLPAVTRAQGIATGQYLGPAGNTGDSNGQHLHLSYFIDGQNVNPEAFLYTGPDPVSEEDIVASLDDLKKAIREESPTIAKAVFDYKIPVWVGDKLEHRPAWEVFQWLENNTDGKAQAALIAGITRGALDYKIPVFIDGKRKDVPLWEVLQWVQKDAAKAATK